MGTRTIESQMPIPEDQTITLEFFGPFKFTKGDNYLFHSECVGREGIYIWTIKDEEHNLNLVHYIGETESFGKRQREHLIQITGLNYRIIDRDSARKGIEKILWNGMLRDRTKDAVANLLDNYDVVSKKVKEYIELINVYFASTKLETQLRKHIEGCIGWNLRTKHPDSKVFYPDDNHVGKKEKPLGLKLFVNLPEDIAGIDKELMI